MFSLQQGDDLAFQISSIEQDLISSHASLETTGILTPPKRKRKKSLLYSNHDHQKEDKYGGSSTCTTTGSNGNKEKIKMTAHRDVERLRRKEMAELYASLRSLLPLEYVKGKRSISDHTNESVNYIKKLQKNINELSIKRDRLKNMANSTADTEGSTESCSSGRVTASLCWGGVEILINSGSEEVGFPMSRVLEILVEEGLDVVSCVSTRMERKLLHVIKSEVTTSANWMVRKDG
ncbi:transcription factor bHLH36-like [Rhododendron vialii]|uniref:transcription factor bHLH36-like n=1 Tax=Rhododendron vialii TaxID=182163 RepID=UPI00265E6933|nr:transcription factor bHLH36-like [Rhododendron vialii]